MSARKKFYRISKSGERKIEKLIIDANILISILIRGKARQVLLHLGDATRFLTTKTKITEVERSLPFIAHKRGLNLELLYDALAALPLEQFSPDHYEEEIEESKKRIGKRDPTDINLLALALKEESPIWSQDKDFQDCGIELYTTEFLLKKLKLIH